MGALGGGTADTVGSGVVAEIPACVLPSFSKVAQKQPVIWQEPESQTSFSTSEFLAKPVSLPAFGQPALFDRDSLFSSLTIFGWSSFLFGSVQQTNAGCGKGIEVAAATQC